jgi:predicted ester cyclase
MSTTAETLIRQWFEELWNQGREDAIDRLLAPNGIAHGLPTPDHQPIVGPAAFKPFYRQFRQAFPDIQISIERAVSSGDFAAVHCRVTGTHRGDAFGPATLRPVEFEGMCIVRTSGGQIVEGWNTFDFMTCFQQIGLLPQLQMPAVPRPSFG